jgi:hypothetical protein
MHARSKRFTQLNEIKKPHEPQKLAHGFAAMEATLMKVIRMVSTTALFLLLGSALPAYAQDDHHDQAAKPEKQDEQAKPAQHQEQAKPVKPVAQARTEKQDQQARPAKQVSPAKSAKPVEHAKSENQAPQKNQVASNNSGGQHHVQRTAAEQQTQRNIPALRLSARGSGRIPDDRFRANFGRDHNFRIGTPTMVGGYSRFQYGGFWFGFVQPWPTEWYYTDNVYIVFVDGGYYLYNPTYPGARVSLSVVI